MGATASGKTALALEAARRWNDVEIVSVDSMLVYRDMDIGTGKPTPAERASVPHHLIDVADPSEDYSVAQFQNAARVAVAAIGDRGHRALLVGGTGLYFSAVVDALTIPGQFPDVRDALSAEEDTAALHARLAGLDAIAAARIEAGNRRRIIRALEVTIGSGRPFSSFGPGMESFPPSPFAIAAIWLPRHVIADRIEQRFDKMLGAGLLDEIVRLAHRPAGLSRTAQQGLGYKELFTHVAGVTSFADARAEVIRRTRRFARRQLMWFRRDPRIVWHGSDTNPFAVLPAILGDWELRCQR